MLIMTFKNGSKKMCRHVEYIRTMGGSEGNRLAGQVYSGAQSSLKRLCLHVRHPGIGGGVAGRPRAPSLPDDPKSKTVTNY